MTPESTLEVRRFAAEDFPTYRAWCADARLNRHLGPMDEEWLAHVLADTEEDHIYWLEKQLGLIEKVGLQNYLQSQM